MKVSKTFINFLSKNIFFKGIMISIAMKGEEQTIKQTKKAIFENKDNDGKNEFNIFIPSILKKT